MLCRRFWLILAALAGGAGGSVIAPSRALAAPRIVSESVDVDLSAGRALFRILLDERPDFHTVDEFDRPAFSFQYEFDSDWTGRPGDEPLDEIRAVVRGDEVRLSDTVRVRDALGEPDPDPVAGGWGAIRAEMPLEVDGTELSFAAPLEALGEDDGVYAYRAFTTAFGETTSLVEVRVTPIPLPAALMPAAATMAGLAIAGLLLRRRNSRLPPLPCTQGRSERNWRLPASGRG